VVVPDGGGVTTVVLGAGAVLAGGLTTTVRSRCAQAASPSAINVIRAMAVLRLSIWSSFVEPMDNPSRAELFLLRRAAAVSPDAAIELSPSGHRGVGVLSALVGDGFGWNAIICARPMVTIGHSIIGANAANGMPDASHRNPPSVGVIMAQL